MSDEAKEAFKVRMSKARAAKKLPPITPRPVKEKKFQKKLLKSWLTKSQKNQPLLIIIITVKHLKRKK